jgi:hypothetical protein
LEVYFFFGAFFAFGLADVFLDDFTIMANFNVGKDAKLVNAHLKLALRTGVKNKSLKQLKGTGASGSFKIGEVKAALPSHYILDESMASLASLLSFSLVTLLGLLLLLYLPFSLLLIFPKYIVNTTNNNLTGATLRYTYKLF